MTQTNLQESVRFGRALAQDEWAGYEQAIQQAKQVLGTDHLGLITPIRSLPLPAALDTGMGNLLGAKDFLKFIRKLGFDTLQVDPDGKTKSVDASPYMATIFSSSPLQIDLTPLARDKAWAGILSEATLKQVVDGNPNKTENQVPYGYIFQAQTEALNEACQAFRQKLAALNTLPGEEAKTITAINTQFQAFVAKNQSWLKPDSLYEALTAEYGNDYWPIWKGEKATLDKNLFNHQDETQAKAAQARIAELEAQYPDVIANHQFVQFIAHAQKDDIKAFCRDAKLDLMADRQIGFSDRDVWAYQSVFLKGYAMGAPPDYFSNNGQAWGFPVLDPDQIFNADGSLGAGGLLLQRITEKILDDYPQGFRKDHAIGDIDPWVYPANQLTTKPETGGARLFSSPERFPQFSRITEADLKPAARPDDEDWVLPEAMTPERTAQYATILDKIVLPTLEARGLPKSAIIFEDLGTLTTPVKTVLEGRDLSGIRVTTFVDPNKPKHPYHGRNVGPEHWITPGTHDNKPTPTWVKGEIFKKEPLLALHAKNLSEELVINPAQREAFAETLRQDPLTFLKAKYTELFVSPARNIQLFFADLFGLEDSYNSPSTSGDDNWRLRIPQDYEAAYFRQVQARQALNLPEVMAAAIEAKGDAFQQAHQGLLDTLKTYAERLRA